MMLDFFKLVSIDRFTKTNLDPFATLCWECMWFLAFAIPKQCDQWPWTCMWWLPFVGVGRGAIQCATLQFETIFLKFFTCTNFFFENIISLQGQFSYFSLLKTFLLWFDTFHFKVVFHGLHGWIEVFLLLVNASQNNLEIQMQS